MQIISAMSRADFDANLANATWRAEQLLDRIKAIGPNVKGKPTTEQQKAVVGLLIEVESLAARTRYALDGGWERLIYKGE